MILLPAGRDTAAPAVAVGYMIVATCDLRWTHGGTSGEVGTGPGDEERVRSDRARLRRGPVHARRHRARRAARGAGAAGEHVRPAGRAGLPAAEAADGPGGAPASRGPAEREPAAGRAGDAP